MAVAFPPNPEINDTFEAAGLLYTWDGTRWLSAFQPGVNYTGPKGDDGATGATGPEPGEITITQSTDDDLSYAIPFVSNDIPTGISTVFKDTDGLLYNPGTNLLSGQQLQMLGTRLVFAEVNAADQIVLFTNPSAQVNVDGVTASGFYGDITISNPNTASTVLSIDVTDNARTDVTLVGKIAATGDVVSGTYHIFNSGASEGFEVTNEQYITEAIPSPIDQPQGRFGFGGSTLLGVFYSRNSTNNKFVNFGFLTTAAGTYEIDWRISRVVTGMP